MRFHATKAKIYLSKNYWKKWKTELPTERYEPKLLRTNLYEDETKYTVL